MIWKYNCSSKGKQNWKTWKILSLSILKEIIKYIQERTKVWLNSIWLYLHTGRGARGATAAQCHFTWSFPMPLRLISSLFLQDGETLLITFALVSGPVGDSSTTDPGPGRTLCQLFAYRSFRFLQEPQVLQETFPTRALPSRAAIKTRALTNMVLPVCLLALSGLWALGEISLYCRKVR